MRPASWWTTLRYRLRRFVAWLAWCWHWLAAGGEELAILVGFMPRYRPPPRRHQGNEGESEAEPLAGRKLW